MTEKSKYQARKTPSSSHPANPPQLPANLEVIYYAVNEPRVDQAVSSFRDQIVTSQVLYEPAVLAAARIHFHGSRWEVHSEREVVKVVPFPPQPQLANWESSLIEKWDNHHVLVGPQGVSFYLYDSSFDFSANRFDELQEEFLTSLISLEVMEIQFNPSLKLDKKMDESEESFLARCLDTARAQSDVEMKTLEETLQRLQNRLTEKLEREVREIGKENLEEGASVPEDHQTQMAVRESIATIDDVNKELEELQVLKETKRKQFEDEIEAIARQREKDILRINRANVEVLRFALVWLPYTEFVVQEAEHRYLKLIRSF